MLLLIISLSASEVSVKIGLAVPEITWKKQTDSILCMYIIITILYTFSKKLLISNLRLRLLFYLLVKMKMT